MPLRIALMFGGGGALGAFGCGVWKALSARLRGAQVCRPPLDHDAVSGQFDYSPERIDELIELGMAQADAAWDLSLSAQPAQGKHHGLVQLPRLA